MDTITTKRGSVSGPNPNSFEISASGPVSPSQVVIDAEGDLGGGYVDATGLRIFTQPSGGAATTVSIASGIGYFKIVGIDANGAVYGVYDVTDPATQDSVTYSFKDSGGTLTTLAGPRGAANAVVRSVNGSGVAVGTYTDVGGKPQAFFRAARRRSSRSRPATATRQAPPSRASARSMPWATWRAPIRVRTENTTPSWPARRTRSRPSP